MMSIFRRNKPKADFSGVQSGSSSTAPTESAPSEAEATGTAGQTGTTGSAARTYTVVKGDTLSAIAKREYGNANQWRRIHEANRDTIKNPDLIYPGQVLNIPPAE